MSEAIEKFKVYVKLNEHSQIISINNSRYLNDIEGWTYIDEGLGSKYYNAQFEYLPDTIFD